MLVEIYSCAVCWRLRYISVAFRKEGEQVGETSEQLDCILSWCIRWPIRSWIRKEWIFLVELMSSSPLSCKTLYRQKEKWIFKHLLYWHGWINNRNTKFSAWCKDIWGLDHEYINVIDVWLRLLPLSYQCIWLQVCFSCSLLLLSQRFTLL